MQHIPIPNHIHKTNSPIDGNTKIFALIGKDLSYSLSFQLHNTAFQHFHYNAMYIPLEFNKNPLSFFHSLCDNDQTNIQGCNITTPYKSTLLEENSSVILSKEVQQTGSMNTLIQENHRWIARNSDIEGFVQSVSHLDFQNKDILILGAGGVTKSVLYALRHMMNLSPNQDIYIYNRTTSKAKALANIYDLHWIQNLHHWPHKSNSVIINCTSQGQGIQKSLMAFDDPRSFTEDHIVIDLVYHRTPLLKKAHQDKAITCNGLSMLIWQAALSFSWWTNTDVQACRDIMHASLSNHSLTFDV